ncbi:MAG: hypothetical protein K0S12_2492 [Bacteroidetes bacterium]|nr:hypothetical protein [Bacteroidota bacterium]
MRFNLYYILVGVSSVLLACILIFSKKRQTGQQGYKERKDNIALAGEWLNTKSAMKGLLAAIEENPDDIKSMLELSQAYIQEGRITGDHAFYDKAALEMLDKVLKVQPDNFEALCFKSTVLLSQHHFAEGMIIAKRALPLNPNNAFIYGILCDANVELGNYKEAVVMADKMVSIRPDIRSYARISYLREIHGDLSGAIQAIKMAVESGYPGLEQREWTRCVLAHLYETTGKLDSAQLEYKTALKERPDYAFAIAGLGRIEKAKGNYKEAIPYFEKAKQLITEYSFSDELTDLYRLNKENTKAEKNAREVIAMLSPSSDLESEEGHGHYADKELAYAYLKINELDNALNDICETLAWVKYKRNELPDALKLITKALRTKCRNPELNCRAGIILIKNGMTEEGKKLIKTALEINPFIDIELKNEVNPYLAQI